MELHEGFGQSESSVLLANFPWIKVRPGSMGKPAPLYGIKLLDEDGNECEDGVTGAISITGTDKSIPPASSGAIGRTRRSPKPAGTTGCTAPVTWPGGTRTDIIGLLGATTT